MSGSTNTSENEVPICWGVLQKIGGCDSPAMKSPVKYILNSETVSFGRVHPKESESKTTFYAISVPYLSSTHFSIRNTSYNELLSNIKLNPTSSCKYFIRSVGRNGTFINSKLIPNDEDIEIEDGANISIKFRNEEKLVFAFSASFMKTPSNTQLHNIQQPYPVDVAKIKLLEEELNTLKKSQEAINERVSILSQQVSTKQQEIHQYKSNEQKQEIQLQDQQMRIMELESNLAAAEARRIHTEKANTEYVATMDQLRKKISTLEADSTNISQLSGQIKTLEHEMRLQQLQIETKDKKIEEMSVENEESKISINRLKSDLKYASQELKEVSTAHALVTTTNQALQDVIAQYEQSMVAAQTKKEDLSVHIIKIQEEDKARAAKLRHFAEEAKTLMFCLTSQAMTYEESTRLQTLAAINNKEEVIPETTAEIAGRTRRITTQVDQTQVSGYSSFAPAPMTVTEHTLPNIMDTSSAGVGRHTIDELHTVTGELVVGLRSSPPHEMSNKRKYSLPLSSYNQSANLQQQQDDGASNNVDNDDSNSSLTKKKAKKLRYESDAETCCGEEEENEEDGELERNKTGNKQEQRATEVVMPAPEDLPPPIPPVDSDNAQQTTLPVLMEKVPTEQHSASSDISLGDDMTAEKLTHFLLSSEKSASEKRIEGEKENTEPSDNSQNMPQATQDPAIIDKILADEEEEVEEGEVVEQVVPLAGTKSAPVCEAALAVAEREESEEDAVNMQAAAIQRWIEQERVAASEPIVLSQ